MDRGGRERGGRERGGMDRWKEERWERDRQMKGGVGEWEEWIDGEKEEQGSTYIHRIVLLCNPFSCNETKLFQLKKKFNRQRDRGKRGAKWGRVRSIIKLA